MDQTPTLLPLPRHLIITEGTINLSARKVILLDCDPPQSYLFSALFLQDAIKKYIGLNYEINASKAIPGENVGITLRIETASEVHPQGYSLRISPTGILLQAKEAQGLFYGCCTLIQLIQYYLHTLDQNDNSLIGSLPCLEISDWPDFTHRGVMIDISRDKVPTMETIFGIVDLLAFWKINQLQLYTEHTFAYQAHPEVWKYSSPFTGEEILKLDKYCRQRYVELVPNQSSFGHMERWLKHPRYKFLAEAPDGFNFPWGHHDGPFSLCPILPASLDLISNLYDELLPHFSSRQVNINCDETFDVGQGLSKDQCAQVGEGRVYLDFLLQIYKKLTSSGFRMQFWGDIIINHPELIAELPMDCIALEWGYEADHPFDEHGEKFARAGLPFYVCPGTSSWNSISGRTDNCIQNLSNAAINGIKYGAEGYLITDWGDNGHWQALPVSYLGFATGAAFSWVYSVNESLNIKDALNRYAFQDTSGMLGNLAYDLGNIYKNIGVKQANSSVIFTFLKEPIRSWQGMLEPDAANKVLNIAIEHINQLEEFLSQSNSFSPDKDLLHREFQQSINLLRHGCKRGKFGFGDSSYTGGHLAGELHNIVTEYEDVWLKRNRPGGLTDSLANFQIALCEYLQ